MDICGIPRRAAAAANSLSLSIYLSLPLSDVSLGDQTRSPFACRMLIVDLSLLSSSTKLHSGPLTLAMRSAAPTSTLI
jgi:hypothetical protein